MRSLVPQPHVLIAAVALLLGGGVIPDAPLGAQPTAADTATASIRPWYERIRIRGYVQLRYNELFESNPDFRCDQCDRSMGGTGGFFLRRARIILQGQLHPRVFMYIQPDFASGVGTSLNVGQLRDAYVDVGLDDANAWRVRIGQSKIPFSFENMQSSSERLPLDRADATNSSAVNERDAGVFLMWAPPRVRERYRRLVADGLKGSGDYGAFAIGVHNGQGLNRPEANDGLHVVARLTWPFEVRGRLIEPGIAAYGGEYVLPASLVSDGVGVAAGGAYRDERVLVSLAVAPQPFGLLAEYNVGRGPEYDPARNSITTQRLAGGFVTLMWRTTPGTHVLTPFLRVQAYDGGKKFERDARSYEVWDREFGLEWQPNPNFELVAVWYVGDRRFEDALRPVNRQRGRLLRLQAQLTY